MAPRRQMYPGRSGPYNFATLPFGGPQAPMNVSFGAQYHGPAGTLDDEEEDEEEPPADCRDDEEGGGPGRIVRPPRSGAHPRTMFPTQRRATTIPEMPQLASLPPHPLGIRPQPYREPPSAKPVIDALKQIHRYHLEIQRLHLFVEEKLAEYARAVVASRGSNAGGASMENFKKMRTRASGGADGTTQPGATAPSPSRGTTQGPAPSKEPNGKKDGGSSK